MIMKKHIYIALSGYYNDALSRERRDTFLAQLKIVKGALDAIMESSQYSQYREIFSQVRENINSMIGLIDTYSEKIAEKFGAGCGDEEEPMEEKKEEKKKKKEKGEKEEGGDDEEEEVEGGDDEDEEFGEVSGGAGKYDIKIKDPSTWRSVGTLYDAIRKFDYYYKVAQIRENLKKTAGELDYYGEKYTDMRASAIAKEVDEVKENMNKILKKLKEKTGFKDKSPDDGIPEKD